MLNWQILLGDFRLHASFYVPLKYPIWLVLCKNYWHYQLQYVNHCIQYKQWNGNWSRHSCLTLNVTNAFEDSYTHLYTHKDSERCTLIFDMWNSPFLTCHSTMNIQIMNQHTHTHTPHTHAHTHTCTHTHTHMHTHTYSPTPRIRPWMAEFLKAFVKICLLCSFCINFFFFLPMFQHHSMGRATSASLCKMPAALLTFTFTSKHIALMDFFSWLLVPQTTWFWRWRLAW